MRKRLVSTVALAAMLAMWLGAADEPLPVQPVKLWSFRTAGQQSTLLKVLPERVVVTAGPYVEFGSPQRFLYGLAPETGHPAWTEDLGDRVTSVYVNEAQGNTRAFLDTTDPEMREIRTIDTLTGWKTVKRIKKEPGAPGGGGWGTFSDENGNAFTVRGHTLEFGKLYEYIWRAEFPGTPTRPIRYGELLVVRVAGARTVHGLNRADGRELWRVAVPPVPGVKEPEQINFDLDVSDGRLYVANYDGLVTAWSLAGNTLPRLETLEVIPDLLDRTVDGLFIFTPGGRIKSSNYTKYTLSRRELLRALGGKLPRKPFRVVVRIEAESAGRVEPADPRVQAPIGGFHVTTRRCAVVGVPCWD